MSTPHNFFIEKVSLYRKWHNQSFHLHVHFILLIACLVISSTLIYGSAKSMYEVEAAAPQNQAAYSIELDMPDYQPEYLHHPQNFFSGRDYKIIKHEPTNGKDIEKENEKSISVSEVTFNKITKGLFGKKKTEIVKLKTKLSEERFPVITIPKEIQTGTYSLDFTDEFQQVSVPITIDGTVATPTGSALSGGDQFDPTTTTISRLNCYGCSWESVLITDPKNEQVGYLMSSGVLDGLYKTTDGWASNTLYHLDQVTYPLLKYTRGDPWFAYDANKKLNILELFYNPTISAEPITGGIYVDSTTASSTVITVPAITSSGPTLMIAVNGTTLDKANTTGLSIPFAWRVNYPGTVSLVVYLYDSVGSLVRSVNVLPAYTSPTGGMTSNGIVTVPLAIAAGNYKLKVCDKNKQIATYQPFSKLPIFTPVCDSSNYFAVASGAFSQTIVQPVPSNLDPQDWIVMDYANMTIDTNTLSPYFGNKYVFANSIKFEDGSFWQGQFVVSKSGQITRQKAAYSSAITSAAVGLNGEVYAVQPYGNVNGTIALQRSLDGGKTYVEKTVSAHVSSYCVPRLSTISNRVAPFYSGPDVVVDGRGRIYVAWADFKTCITDSNFEYSSYGFDSDIYVSYSDDKGDTWSTPLKVNDDNSGGDQSFPSLAVDGLNNVYVAFVDHRNNQDKSQFDIYMAESKDRGVSFLSNLQVNDKSIPITYGGGRVIGDYFKMVSVGLSKIFVGHPCVSLTQPDINSPSDACMSVISKNLWNPQPVLPSLSVLSPISINDVWLTGTDHDVVWSTVGIPRTNFVKITLVDSKTSTEYDEISSTANTGVARLHIPDSLPNGSYKVKVSLIYNGTNYINTGVQTVQIKTPTPPQVTINNATLTLTYDINKKESQLVASYTINFTAGTKPVNLASYPFNFTASDGNSNHTMYSIGTSDSADQVINPGDTKIITVKGYFNPATMFAGVYHASLLNIPTNPVIISGEMTDATVVPVPSNTTNEISVIGEISPYITSAAPISVAIGQKVLLKGQRFDTLNNTIYIGYNGQNAIINNVPSTNSSTTTLSFTVPSGLVVGQSYTVQIETTNGRSNSILINIISPVISPLRIPLPPATQL